MIHTQHTRPLLVLALASIGLLHGEVLLAQSVEIPAAVLDAERQRIETVRKAAPAVVAIFAAGGQGGGSGVIVSPDGFTVTNFHVVQGQGPFMKCGLNDGNIYDAVLVGIDPTGDVAVIQMLGRDDFPTATIANSDDVQMGDWTFAMGNPFLLAEDLQPTVTYGMVSGTHRYQYPAGTFLEYTDCIQVDTSINPGNSGGPLFNDRGELIGINGRISVEKRGRVNVGAGYAISINQVQHFMDHLKSGRIVDHATLGATVTSTSDGSVIVANILERSSAFHRGLRSGDELITFAGRPIRSVNQFKNILGIYPKGWVLPLSFRREGKRADIQVRLMALHRAAELTPDGPAPMPHGGPDEKKPDEKEPPKPLPIPGMSAPKAAIPEAYAHLFKAKRGFVNYYFNEQQQQQLLSAFDGWGDFAAFKGLWTLNFTRNDGLELQLKLTDKVLAAKLGQDFIVQSLDEEYRELPLGTGGLLAAVHQFRHLLSDPAGHFTEFYYLGSEPLDGGETRVDVLVSTRGQVTSRWYFQRNPTALVGFDTTLTDDVPPCEIRFSETLSSNSLILPKNWQLRYLNQDLGTFVLQSMSLEAGESK